MVGSSSLGRTAMSHRHWPGREVCKNVGTVALAGVVLAGATLAIFYGAIVVIHPTMLLPGLVQGTDFDVARARQVVAEQRPLLARVRALLDMTPLPSCDAPECRKLAQELGELDIRLESRTHGPRASIVYRRSGLAERYEQQLTWVPAATAENVRAGRETLGEHREYIADGWWRVVW
jgi:hypothetical protein